MQVYKTQCAKTGLCNVPTLSKLHKCPLHAKTYTVQRNQRKGKLSLLRT